MASLQQEKEQLGQQLASAQESGRRAEEELGRKDRELSGNGCRLVGCCLPLCLSGMPKVTFRFVCSAQGEHQKAPG